MNKKVDITEIKGFLNQKKVSGFVWNINEKYPRIFNNEIISINDSLDAKNQIQEGYLNYHKVDENDKNKNDTVSIRIVNSDSTEHCFVYEESFFKKEEGFKIDSEIIEYPSHIKDKNNKRLEYLHFKQVYKLTQSLSEAGFKTWQPIMQFFAGLELTKK